MSVCDDGKLVTHGKQFFVHTFSARLLGMTSLHYMYLVNNAHVLRNKCKMFLTLWKEDP